jgi:hypothetical protein
MPEGATLTATFGWHLALLASPDRERLNESAAEFMQLYRLRSRLVHGETGIDLLPTDDETLLPVARSLLLHVIARALQIRHELAGGTKLHQLLLNAVSNPAAHARLWPDAAAPSSP